MRRGTATTLHDVAKEAGVTAMTVSVVLNGARSATRVSDATRVRIQEAALRLKYRPNAVARGLSRRRMDTIGVVASIDCGGVNHYILEVLSGILRGARLHTQNTTVFSVGSWNEEEQQRILHFCDGRVDGIIMIGPLCTAEFAEQLAHHTPLVSIHPNENFRSSYCLQSDDEGGMYEATKHLVGLGHRRIIHFAGPSELAGARLRYAGFRRAMEEADVTVTDGDVVEGRFDIDSGSERMAALLGKCGKDSLPTGIVCASDDIAYGCMETLASAGINVPGDISICGFDDTMLARVTQPPLMTVRQPFGQMAERAVELILKQVREEEAARAPGYDLSTLPQAMTHAHKLEVFGVELVVRASVGPPRQTASDFKM